MFFKISGGGGVFFIVFGVFFAGIGKILKTMFFECFLGNPGIPESGAVGPDVGPASPKVLWIRPKVLRIHRKVLRDCPNCYGSVPFF